MKSETVDFDTASASNLTFTTGYQYDEMGRVSQIEYPTINAASANATSATPKASGMRVWTILACLTVTPPEDTIINQG